MCMFMVCGGVWVGGAVVFCLSPCAGALISNAFAKILLFLFLQKMLRTFRVASFFHVTFPKEKVTPRGFV